MTERLYLTVDGKKIILREIENLKARQNDNSLHKSEKLEQPLIEILDTINNNDHIVSLSSSKQQGFGDESYIYIWFSRNIEEKIHQTLAPYFINKFNVRDVTLQGFLFKEGVKCYTSTDDPDETFSDKHFFEIRIKSDNSEWHDLFWSEVREYFSRL